MGLMSTTLSKQTVENRIRTDDLMLKMHLLSLLSYLDFVWPIYKDHSLHWELNSGPYAYKAYALTNWATGPDNIIIINIYR